MIVSSVVDFRNSIKLPEAIKMFNAAFVTLDQLCAQSDHFLRYKFLVESCHFPPGAAITVCQAIDYLMKKPVKKKNCM